MSDKVLFVSLPVQSFLRSNFFASNLPAQADNNIIATIDRNIFQTGDDFYNWVPEGSRDSDDFVPGLDSLLTYLGEEYATIALVEDTNALTITYWW